MLRKKRRCQAQAQNNGGQPWGNGAICMQLFAVSRTTKANQRNLNGGWQASTNAFALCLCQTSPLRLPSRNGPVLFSLRLIKHSSRSFLPPSEALYAVELAGLKVGHDCALECRKRSTEQQRGASTCVLWSAACSHQMAISLHQTSIIFWFHLQGFKSLRV